ncbi:MAG: hypothetical protein A2X86_19695 [Bdellovibrionales bacterium GWA2_49_15]|nr:MAG: hypothetical protein A2X86_19695 [Bdellovibrionales bacterium GWA2_49_15]HAZ13785.1 hypothetical protein [Bdellovibrionales bacterium]
MLNGDKKPILLNLAGDLGDPLIEHLAALGIELVEESSTPDFVLVRDYKSISQNYGDAFIISLAPVDDVTAFAKKNGKAILNEKVLSSSLGLPLLGRLFNSQVSTKLEMNFGALLENCLSVKISGHMHVGYLTDLVVNDAFSQNFRAISLRAFLVFMSTYVAYLERGGICQYPVDLNYGATKDSYVVELVVPANNFFLEYLYPSLGKLNPKNPLEHLLSECLSMSDYLSITQLKNAGKLIISSLWLKGNAPPAFPSLSFCAIDSVKIYERRWQELKKHPAIDLSVAPEMLASNEAKPLPGPGIKPVTLQPEPQAAEEETEVHFKGTDQEKEAITKIKGRFDVDESKVVIKGDEGAIDLTEAKFTVAGSKAKDDKEKWTLKKLDNVPDSQYGILNDKRGKTPVPGPVAAGGFDERQGLLETVGKLIDGDEEAKDDSPFVIKQSTEAGEDELKNPLQAELDEKTEQIKRMKPLMDSMRDQMVSMLKKTKLTQTQFQTMNDTISQLREELQETKSQASEREFKLRAMEAKTGESGENQSADDVEMAASVMALADDSVKEQTHENRQMEEELHKLKGEALQKDKIVQTQSRHFLETITQLKQELEATKAKLGEREFKVREMEARLSRGDLSVGEKTSVVNRPTGNMVPISTLHELENELRLLKDSDERKNRQIDLLQVQLVGAQQSAESLAKQYKTDLTRAKETVPVSMSFGSPVQVQPLSAAEQRNMMNMTESLRDKDAFIVKLNLDLKQSETRQKELVLEVKKLEQKLKMTLAQLQSAEKQKGKKGFGSHQASNETQLQHKVKQLEVANASLGDQQKHMSDEINERKKEIIKLKQEINTLQNANSVLERKLQGKDKAA